MFHIVPSIDLRGGKVVRLQQGDFDRQLNYDVDPVETARAFASDGAQWLHIVDLDGARRGSVAQVELIGKIIAASKLKTQVGGGVRSEKDIQNLLSIGASRVVIGTKAVEDWPWFEKLAANPTYADKLVLALDAREGQVAIKGWTSTSHRQATEIASQVRGWPLAGILYTDVSRDGMLTGPDLNLTKQLTEVTDVPVIASGGVGNLEHIRLLMKLPIWGVIVGRALYDGRVDLKEALHVARTFVNK